MDVPAVAIFAKVGRLTKRFSPVGAAAIVGGWRPIRQPRKCGQEIGIQNRAPRGAQAGRRNDVYDTGSGRRRRKRAARISGVWIDEPASQKATGGARGVKRRIKGGVGEVPGALQGRGYMSAAHSSPDLPVPFLRYKEKDFVLLYGAAKGASEVVPANRIFLGIGVLSLKNGVLCIQNVVAAEVIGAAVKIVGARLGDDADYASGSPAELGAVAVPLNLELLNRVKGGVNKERAIRSYVYVVGSIHKPQVRIRSTAADGDVRAAVEAFLVVTKTTIDRDAGNQRD